MNGLIILIGRLLILAEHFETMLHNLDMEQLKIHCVKKHFKALNSDVEMQCAAKWDDFKSTI